MEHLLARAEEEIDLDKTIGKLFGFYTIFVTKYYSKYDKHYCT